MKNDKKKVSKNSKPVTKKVAAKKPVAKKVTKKVAKKMVVKQPVVMKSEPNYNRIVLVLLVVGLFALVTFSSL